MALFSFRHSVKTFSKKVIRQARIAQKGQTLSHIRYITRESAARTVLSERLPKKSFVRIAAAVEQAAEKSGGRVCERFTIALPLEAEVSQRQALIKAFGEHITKGKAGYIAAIHDKKGNDILNPHAHLICFDTFTRKGGRGRPSSVLGMARKHAVENAAKDWATIHNRMMADWGYGTESAIDHRSYEERGIDQVPTIHEGPGARKLAAADKEITTNAEWEHIDKGHSRAEANKLIRDINKTKEKLNEQRAYRLGGDDDTNIVRSQSRVPWLGESGSDNRGTGRAAPRQSNTATQAPRGNHPPFTSAGSRQGGAERHRAAVRSICRGGPAKPMDSNGLGALDGGRRVRTRRFRRTFYNLKLFHGTLQARLKRDVSSKKILESIDELTNEPSQTQLSNQDTR